jgi:nitrogen regulatory protein P-II 1
MKLVVALIPPERLEAVQEVVDDPAASIVAVSEVGDVREPRLKAFYRGGEYAVARPRMRVEIAVVNEALVPSLVNAIRQAASTGETGRHGCGDVLVIPLDECVRIVREQCGPQEGRPDGEREPEEEAVARPPLGH